MIGSKREHCSHIERIDMSQELHVVIGAGPIGSGTATRLAAAGHRVRVLTRSGSGPAMCEPVVADAADAGRLAGLTGGATAIYNCVNPPYHRWAEEWPPVAAAILAAAERSEAVLVTISNVYGYGPVDHPMTESDPLAATFTKGQVRARMWLDVEAAHRAGRVRAVEARASDYVGIGAESHLGDRVLPRLLAGRNVKVLGDPDAAHSWTAVDDVCDALVLLGRDERAWGRAWHVPTAPPLSQRSAIDLMCDLAGVRRVKVGAMPGWMLSAAGMFNKTIRELPDVLYQVERPFVVDSSDYTRTFGVEATPLADTLATLVAHYRTEAAA
jgi:nucleoside-diphosphate-sugar epimerase